MKQEIPLYKGIAPGSENWTWEENANNNNRAKVMTVYNVVRPSLTVFAPDPGVANGTAIIICPGGGFHFLAIHYEGSHAASWLAGKGITAFVLKYRLVHIHTDNPFDDMMEAEDKKAWDDEALPIIPLAITDGRQAIAYVRSHADEYNIATDRIGIMGFSAGGLIAAATAFDFNTANRPDFVAPIYADIPGSVQSTVLNNAPPLFLACAKDDEFGFASHAAQLYAKWRIHERPAKMHLFNAGGHGFGIGNPANATHRWLDLFTDWLTTESLVNKQ